MPIETITRAAKRYYEELYLQQVERQLFYNLFNIPDESSDAGFLLDTLIGSPYAVTYKAKGGQSHVRPYTPGSGRLIEPPIAAEKTPLTEELLDKLVAGVDAVGGFGRNEAKLVGDIVRQHVSAFNMLKNYQAMQVFVTGIFEAKGKNGGDLDLDIDYSRAAGNALTADFSSVDITAAFTAAINKLRDNGTPLDNLVAILGTNWQANYGADSDVTTAQQNNNANIIAASDMVPPELANIEAFISWAVIAVLV